VVENSALAQRARPFVALLHERTGAAAHLVVPSYQCVVCLVHCADGAQDERPRLRELVPAHCTAGGKVLLAWRDRWRDSVLSAPLERFTDRTVTEPAALRRELEGVREQGHALEDGEYQREVRAVAAPVVVAGAAVGALSVSGRRLDAQAEIAQVRQSAWQLADDLGRRA